MATITIARTGNMPLAFEGQLLAEASSETVRGVRRNRWHELMLFRTAGGQYVARISYRTTWDGEQEYEQAMVLNDPCGAAEFFRGWTPSTVVAGYPPHPSYAEKQARLLADIEADYQALISEVLSSAGPEFVERVD